MAARACLLCSVLAAAFAPTLAAQTGTAPGAIAGETLTVVPDSSLAAGSLHRKLLGEDYRDLWTRPIQLPVFDLAQIGGGLTPTEEGGGLQSYSLRFTGNDGREYVFRSLVKDLTKILPEYVRESGLGRTIRDQLASHHPTGPLVADRLLDAAGVLHVSPSLGIMPDDPVLGEYHDRYAGLIGYFEERPVAGKKYKHDFAGAEDVDGTWDMFEQLAESPKERFDQRSYIRARLMDFLIGDWDRHADQWRWARFKQKHGATWRPVPRDRDQALSNWGGLLLGLARKEVHKLTTFDSTLAVRGLMFSGEILDRHLLGGAAPELYDSVAADLQKTITDSVIDWAVLALPPEHRTDTARIAGTLRARRDDLPRAAREYSRALADDINLFGTEKNDIVQVRRDGSAVEVALYASADSAARDIAYVRRRTDREQSHEVRVYLLGGDDEVLVTGESRGGPTVFLVPGEGADLVRDESSGQRLELYDADSLAVSGHSHRVRRVAYTRDIPTEKNTVPPRDYGRGNSTLPVLNYRSEYGVELGASYSRTDYGFRADPYLTRLTLRLSVATGSGGVRADARYERYRRMSRSRWELLARVSQLTQIGFFGIGNETTTEDNEDPSFNRVQNTQVLLRPSFIFGIKQYSTLEVGPVLRYTNTIMNGDRLIGQVAPRGTPDYGQVGVRAEWNSNWRQPDSTGQRGWWVSGGGTLWPAVWDVESTVGEVHGLVSTILPAASLPLRPVLALRAGARKVWGPYAYFDAAQVGGSRTLRGLREQRYSGDAGVVGNAELRLRLGRVSLFFPLDVGTVTFVDVGRVFVEDESSQRWHAGFGGGLWLSSLGPQNVLSFTVASAEGRVAAYVLAGFMF